MLAFSTGPPGKRPSLLPHSTRPTDSESSSELIHFYVDEVLVSSNGVSLINRHWKQ